MNQIDPQLEVHAPEIAREIQAASQSRVVVITRAEEELSAVGSLHTAAQTAADARHAFGQALGKSTTSHAKLGHSE